MKDSGIKWIGKIPKEWEINKIKYEYRIQTGFTPDTSNNEYYTDENGYTWISIADMSNVDNNGEIDESSIMISEKYINEKHPQIVKKGSLLYSFKLSVGKVAFAKKDLYTNEAIASFNSDNYLRYLYYAAFLIEENANINIYGAKILNQDLIKNSITIIPDKKEQKLIASFLDGKVKKINEIIKDLNNQVNILKKYKKSLITEIVTRGLNPNAELKDSGVDWIGMIPKNWEYRKLKYILKNNCNNLKVGPFGSELSGDDFKDEGYWVYNQRCVLDKNFDNTDVYVNEQKFNELIGFKVFSDDILITTRGTIGKVAIVPKNAKTGILHPCLIRFVVDNNLISNQLVELIFNESSIITEQIYRQSNATTIEVIYSYNLKELLLPIIPIEEQQQIVKYLEKKRREIDNLISNKQMQIEKMEKYKKSLIYEYVTGKRRVKGAEELYG